MEKIMSKIIALFVLLIILASCQKLYRPPLSADYPKDPPVPPYNPEKSSFSFESNITDDGENKLTGVPTNISYVAGITGQAMKIGDLGYLSFDLKDVITNPDGFVSVPLDTIKNLGSFTVAFWMNGNGTAGGPVSDGAQGVFAISNSTQFWGNIEMFLENYTDATDNNAVFLKIHMLNANVSGGGEEWTADNNVQLKNVLNKWTHIALTYDAATSSLSLYKDGAATGVSNKILGGGNYGDIKLDNVTGMVLGSFAFQTDPSLSNHGPEPWAKSFNGALDQFHLYNKALSASEVNDLFTSKQ
ncbi:hypothetical protein BH10BAC2_BH10BAC2_03240 [soil metagenome]